MDKTSLGRVWACLGPTNTGKTFFAVERMLSYQSGIIGFPLRLLARENYDKIVKIKGVTKVALITGEEKIIPPGAQWYVCTVEAMPSLRVDFVAVDEIQLCEDPNRGHIFTQRLLEARGDEETLFLGAQTIKWMLRQLLGGIEITSRPRLSRLTWAGPRKLTKLPPRTAVVSFSMQSVYELAEIMRLHKGGAAIVLGGLSPQTRNAQVEMYMKGEVDYLIATDAIGMGLNLDVNHIAFAGTQKFDGRMMRPLTDAQKAQIAGRAGRYLNDGTFGVTNSLKAFSQKTVEAIEQHTFASVKQIFWRNSHLNYETSKALFKSLQQRPNNPLLRLGPVAEDVQVLKAMMQDDKVQNLAKTPHAIRLLWDVCQVPDFQKILPLHHARLLSQVYENLMRFNTLPEDFLHKHIMRIDNMEGRIDTLIARLAQIRIWSYIVHRSQWVLNPSQWQQETRRVENNLSMRLHACLLQRFVDKKASLFYRGKDKKEKAYGVVRNNGIVLLNGTDVGKVEGLNFQAHESFRPEQFGRLTQHIRLGVTQYISSKIQSITKISPRQMPFDFNEDEKITWEGVPIGFLQAGETLFRPKIYVQTTPFLNEDAQKQLSMFLMQWLNEKIKTLLIPFDFNKFDFNKKDTKIGASVRGILFQMQEGLGTVPTAQIIEPIKSLSPKEKKSLAQRGLRFGIMWSYTRSFFKGQALWLRFILLKAYEQGKAEKSPQIRFEALKPLKLYYPKALMPSSWWLALGYVPIGALALRVDRLENLLFLLGKKAGRESFQIESEYYQIINLSKQKYLSLLKNFGCQIDAQGFLQLKSRRLLLQKARKSLLCLEKGHNFSKGKIKTENYKHSPFSVLVTEKEQRTAKN